MNYPPQYPPPRQSHARPVIITACIVGGVLFLVVALVALCGWGTTLSHMDEQRRCDAAGRQQGVKTRWTQSDGCTKRGILGIRVRVEY